MNTNYVTLEPISYPYSPPQNPPGEWQKMSKSRGNGVSVDEVANGVASVAKGYEFCDPVGNPIDHRAWGVWRDRGGKRLLFHGDAIWKTSGVPQRGGKAAHTH